LNDDKNALNRTFSVVIGDDAGLSSNRAGQSSILDCIKNSVKFTQFRLLMTGFAANAKNAGTSNL